MPDDSPWMNIGLFLVSLYLLRLWTQDYKKRTQLSPNERMPGTAPCSASAVWIAILGALMILLVEVATEYGLGIVEQQTSITWLFLLTMVSAAFVEELIFRGYLVVESKGIFCLWGSVFLLSALFTLLHPYIWKYEAGRLSFDLGPKALFSSGIVFANSLWFYTVRFFVFNPQRSLIPSILAHLVGNIGVFVIKAMQGFVVGIW